MKRNKIQKNDNLLSDIDASDLANVAGGAASCETTSSTSGGTTETQTVCSDGNGSTWSYSTSTSSTQTITWEEGCTKNGDGSYSCFDKMSDSMTN